MSSVAKKTYAIMFRKRLTERFKGVVDRVVASSENARLCHRVEIWPAQATERIIVSSLPPQIWPNDRAEI